MALIRGSVDRLWELTSVSTDDPEQVDPASDAVFKINDITLAIPPVQISVRKEDMYWQWNTLRSRVSTKVPSGHGLVQVSLNIVFTPDMLITLHRLIVQFKHSPFCWVENAYLRQTIVPDWPVYQCMAFSLASINVSPMKGAPGTFTCELDLRWFNYSPYAVNFLFRRDWVSEPVKLPLRSDQEEALAEAGYPEGDEFTAFTGGHEAFDDDEDVAAWHAAGSKVTYSIPVWIGDAGIEGTFNSYHQNAWYTGKQEETEGQWLPTVIDWSGGTQVYNEWLYASGSNVGGEASLTSTYDVATESGDSSIPAGMSLHDMERSHAGFSFDLLPLPSKMQASAWVCNPALSNIYVRYINSLQAKSLYDNFGISVYSDLNDPSLTSSRHEPPNVKAFLTQDDTTRLVSGLHTGAVPVGIRQKWITQLLFTMKRTVFHYTEYKNVDIDPDIIFKMREAQQKIQEAAIAEQNRKRNALEDSTGAGSPARGSASIRGYTGRRRTYIPGESKSTNLTPKRRADMPSMLLHRPCLNDDSSGASTVNDHLSWRWVHPTRFEQSFHAGIDLNTPVGTPIYALADGTVSEASGTYLRMYIPGLQMGYAYRHLETIADGIVRDAEVTRGQFLGTTGDERGKFGAHLHFEMFGGPGRLSTEEREPYGSHGSYINPIPWLEAKAGETPQTHTIVDIVNNMTEEEKASRQQGAPPPGSTTNPVSDSSDAEAPDAAADESPAPVDIEGGAEPAFVLEDEDDQTTLLTRDEFEALQLPAEEIDGLLGLFATLANNGFMYYDSSVDVSNVWYKVHSHAVVTANEDLEWSSEGSYLNDATTELLMRESAVLVGVAGGMRHQIASIPILGSEFPTHQHLGSTEPSYMLEFSLMDDTMELTGIPVVGQLLEGMRQMLQRNARVYRPVPDGYALIVDNFITRLFGTCIDSDYGVNDSDQPVLKKRACITRSTHVTKEGSPGLTSMVFEISETNPYVQEEIVAVPTASTDIEERRKKILNALVSLELDSQGMIALLLSLTGEKVTSTQLSTDPTDMGDINPYRDAISDQLETSRIDAGIPDSYPSTMAVFTEDTTFRNGLSGGLQLSDPDGFYAKLLGEAGISGTSYTATGYPKEAFQMGGVFGNDYMMYGRDIQKLYGEDSVIAALDYPAGLDPDPLEGELAENSNLARSALIDNAQDQLYIVSHPGSKLRELAYQETDSDIFHVNASIVANYVNQMGDDLTNDVALTHEGILEKDPTFGGYGPEAGEYVEDVIGVDPSEDTVAAVDVTEFYYTNPELSDVDIEKVHHYYTFANALIQEANTLVSEPTVDGAVTEAYFKEQLYDLPGLEQEMWRRYGYWMYTWMMWEMNSSVRGASSWFGGMEPEEEAVYLVNWLGMNLGEESNISRLGVDPFNTQSEYQDHLDQYLNWSDTVIKGSLQVLPNIFTGISGGLSYVHDVFHSDIESDSWKQATEAGDLNSYPDGSDLVVSDTPLVDAPLYSELEAAGDGIPDWVSIGPIRMENQREAWNNYVSMVVGEYIDQALPLRSGLLVEASNTILAPFKQFLDTTMIENTSYTGFQGHLYGLHHWSFVPSYLQSSGSVTNGTFRYTRPEEAPVKTSEEYEHNKIRKIKQGLVKLADLMLNDIPLLKLFGLEELASWDISGGIASWSGIQCYSDMNLPSHPYYPDRLHATNPDFYMWSIYEDASGALSANLIDELQTNMGKQLIGAYNHLKGMQGPGIESADDKGLSVQSDGHDIQPKMSHLIHHPEGTDARDSLEKNGDTYEWITQEGEAMSTPYWDITEWEAQASRAEGSIKKLKEKVDAVDDSTDEGKAEKKKLEKQLERLEVMVTEGGLKPLVPYLSISDGILESPLGRVNADTYASLVEKIRENEVMFGSKAGYMGEYLTDETATNVVSSTEDTRIAAMDTYTHAFDPNSLMNIANDSSKDIISQKLTMRRAYPTFKLMFIEEDEVNNRFLNFDDFYTYNGVKEFTVVQSRERAADTATIVLQNVAGTLDGTRRNATTDLDYFNEDRVARIEGVNDGTVNPHNNVPEAEDGSSQPFTSVVIRPGMNIQLRAGYSNDPNMLEVLISGRAVDVVWNTQGDLCEITVQSFGVELTAALKGRNDGRYGEGDSELIFDTTHKLLSSMMLSPECEHFGRWKIGQLYQYGEAKDADLDFVDYSEKDFWGFFKVTGKLSAWMRQHPIKTGIIGSGLALASVTPWGRVGRLGGGWVARIFGGASKLGAFGARFTAGGTRALGFLGRPGYGTTMQSIRVATANALRTVTRVGTTPGSNLWLIEAQAAMQILTRTAGTATARSFTVIDDLIRAGVPAGGTALQGLKTALANLSKIRGAAASSADDIAKGLVGVQEALVAVNTSQRNRMFGLVLGFKGGFAPISLGMWQGLALPVLGNALNVSFRVAANGTRAALLALGIGLGTDLLRAGFGKAYDAMIGHMRRNFTRKRSLLKLSPQDDNLYPPNPLDYMELDWEFWSWETVSTGALGTALGTLASVFSSSENIGEDVAEWYEKWTNPEDWRLDKRMEPSECLYHLQNSTIWDVFHEMSLRHPGWIYGARPYGTALRYTMFFGVPGQRYWSKPVTNNFVHRMNTLRDHLENGHVTESVYKKLYGENAFTRVQRAVAHALDTAEAEARESGEGPGSRTEEQSKAQLNLRMTNEVLEEYLKGLENRFVPFRRYHMLRDTADIVSNNIMGSEHNVVNAVSVVYHDKDRMVTKTLPMKASSFIKDKDINQAPVYYPNIIGRKAAMRYGMSSLLYGLRKMYRGELLILGNARIKPWDVCILLDDYNDMHGPIEVEQVVHMFSYETGFLTEIKPNALVFANEIATWPILEGLKLFCMAVRDKEEGSGRTGPSENLAEGSIDVPWSPWNETGVTDPKTKADLEARYGTMFSEGFNLEKFIADFSTSDPDVMAGFSNAEVPGADAAQFTAALLAAGVAGGLALGLGRLGVGTQFAKSIVGQGKWARGIANALGIGGAAAGGDSAWHAINDNFRGMGGSWLIAGPILFAKCLQEETVAVVPLTKGGKPIVSGLQQGDPMALWRNIFGDVTNIIDDTMWGIEDLTQEWSALGYAWWNPGVVSWEVYKEAFRGDAMKAATGRNTGQR